MPDVAPFAAALERGDHRAAATWLVRTHASDVLSFCRTLVRDLATAEDLAQDTFASAFGGLPGLRLESSPRTWLLAIARHRCIDHLRRHKRAPFALASEPETVEHHPDDDTPLGPELLQRRDDVVRALSVLDEPSRALVMLRFRHGLEYGELAEVFGQKEGAIRMRLSRALARMREELGGEPLRMQTAMEGARGSAPLARPRAAAVVPRAPAAPPAARPPVPAPAPPAPAAPPPAPGAPPPAAAPALPAAASSGGAGALPPPRRRGGLWSSLFGGAKKAASPATPELHDVLASLDETPDAFLARLEALAADA
ncbi:MAG: RNA polymerase sigma factor [Polyangiales bacterium]|nr:RNA polymerase sigma factor [Sandaracinus sp.]MCB9624740.1 RNA polymerase sigma factor [Sandaracinus sp.]